MLKDSAVKKVSKKFTNFSEEEEWLQSMLSDGWILKSYNSEDLAACQTCSNLCSM